MDKTMSRRAVLLRGLQIPVAGGLLLGLVGCESGDSNGSAGVALVCANPDDMTSAQASVRKTLRYTEVSADTAKTCAGCAFFFATADGCGSCGIFDGNAVNSAGHCDSWSADS
ncbi:high-potential iron-sulfur protein [Congregibacter sp.]|uniref:high-potential iron-sulfur protein n=1 Tax=Congregibacter sp. TaxID=2744308 RepID=UPI00385EE985